MGDQAVLRLMKMYLFSASISFLWTLALWTNTQTGSKKVCEKSANSTALCIVLSSGCTQDSLILLACSRSYKTGGKSLHHLKTKRRAETQQQSGCQSSTEPWNTHKTILTKQLEYRGKNLYHVSAWNAIVAAAQRKWDAINSGSISITVQGSLFTGTTFIFFSSTQQEQQSNWTTAVTILLTVF